MDNSTLMSVDETENSSSVSTEKAQRSAITVTKSVVGSSIIDSDRNEDSLVMDVDTVEDSLNIIKDDATDSSAMNTDQVTVSSVVNVARVEDSFSIIKDYPTDSSAMITDQVTDSPIIIISEAEDSSDTDTSESRDMNMDASLDSSIEIIEEFPLTELNDNVMNLDLIKKILDYYQPCNQKIDYKLTLREEIIRLVKFDLEVLYRIKCNIFEERFENISEEVIIELYELVINRVYDFYGHLFTQLPVDTKLMQGYYDFSIQNRQYVDRFSDMLSKLLLNKHEDPHVYVLAAKYNFKYSSDIKRSRMYFAECFKFHNKNVGNLLLENFSLEVDYLNNCEGASLYTVLKKYHELIEVFENDRIVHLQVLNIVLNLDEIKTLQNTVIRDLIEKYKHEALLWAELFRLNTCGYIYCYENEKLYFEADQYKKTLLSFNSFEEGLTRNLDFHVRNQIWKYYADSFKMLKSNENIWQSLKVELTEMMNRAFNRAHKDKAFKDSQYYIFWAINTDTIQDKVIVLRKGTEVIKNDLELWKTLMLCIPMVEINLFVECLIKGIENLQNDATVFWKTVMVYLSNKIERTSVTNELIRMCLLRVSIEVSDENIALDARIQFLSWSLAAEVNVDFKPLIKQYFKSGPLSKDLYLLIIETEFYPFLEPQRLNVVRSYYEEAVNKFGKNDIDLWRSYLRFEFGRGTHDHVNKVYETSLMAMDEEHKSEMTKLFHILQNHYSGGFETVVLDD